METNNLFKVFFSNSFKILHKVNLSKKKLRKMMNKEKLMSSVFDTGFDKVGRETGPRGSWIGVVKDDV